MITKFKLVINIIPLNLRSYVTDKVTLCVGEIAKFRTQISCLLVSMLSPLQLTAPQDMEECMVHMACRTGGHVIC